MTRRIWIAIAFAAVAVAPLPAVQSKPANPHLILDTVKGPVDIELFPADAPKSVAHILALATRGFYRGLRFHRVTDSLVQVGDPMTRDVSREAYWGTGGSGDPIGVAEISRRLTHVRGTVALAHAGNPAYADSQFYIMKRASPSLDGKYTIIGRVASGMAVVDQLKRVDLLRNLTVKEADPQ